MTTALIVADAGAAKGMGHLRRCLVLADALAARGATCRFAVPDVAARDEANSCGYGAIAWPDALDTLESADMLIGDGYELGLSETAGWRGRYGVRAMISDTAAVTVDADLLINPNIYGSDEDYSACRVGEFLLGKDYALVAPRFAALRGTRRPDIPPRVLVSYGGTDDGSYGAAAAAAILSRTDAIVELVISPWIDPAHAVATLADHAGERLRVHFGADMVELMGRCSVLAGAASTIFLEALAAGLRVVVCGFADNHGANVRAIRALGLAAFDRFDADAIASAVSATLAAPETGGPAIIDGHGADRVCDRMLAMLNESAATAPAGAGRDIR